MDENIINNTYNLVHITTGGEYRTPLVASQLFDQAEMQAVIKDSFAPRKVEVWIIGSMREYYDKRTRNKIKALKERCANIDIYMLNGIGRLKNFPAFLLLKYKRLLLGKKPVIYHCRGEHAVEWAIKLKDEFRGDKIVLDVRGYWPAELLYKRNIYDPALAKGKDLDDYNLAESTLKYVIDKADAITTVSNTLKRLLITEMKAASETYVVPCCISHITNDEKREEIRKSWRVKDNEIVLVYSGTTNAYQHLSDLTIPFLNKLAKLNNKIRLAFLSSESEKIERMLVDAGMNIDNIILKNLPQNEVATALTACDAGILIRKPTLVNQVANPVKIAEYLASGLPIIIENGIGGVADKLFELSILKGVDIAIEGVDWDVSAKEVNNWINNGIKDKRQLAREYAKEVYLWSSAIQISRKMYHDVLIKL